uniref:Polypyrimidine tractbinding protein putative n=1 Tax=Albugo laibachii Nc14 TaxID=890382 RepID=F0WJZ8_9STRA|nr:polypyrimidine tractbinding protein putative [Albugo laibachii Nc14]|eukprot:CCA21600.1 polypyrimidine tractbinding protein putative [Albugo laibachii Nc14]
MTEPATGKRGSNEFENNRQMSKRARSSNPESRVVFVHGLPQDCLESELLALCCPFAVVEKSLLITQKSQAFVQLPDVSSATNLINFYQTRDAMIRGARIFFEYSNRSEITTRAGFQDDSSVEQHHTQRSNRPTTRQEQPADYDNVLRNQHSRSGNGASGRRGYAGAPNTILMVTVTKIEYDVTVDVLQQVFQKFGNVQKVVTFWKNEEFKALVQMESIDQAQAAQQALDGRDIYTGCNTLGIVFSRHPELRVRFNNDRSWDYMNPGLPPGPSADSSGPEMNYEEGPMPGMLGDVPNAQGRGSTYGPRSDFVEEQDGYMDGPRFDSRGPGPERFDDEAFGHMPPGYILPPHSTGRSLRPDKRRSPVLICSNMDQKLVTPDRLFTFFGCFGDVVRVKIMFRKQDTALIQFVDDFHATSALDHLDGVYLFNKKLRVDYSKHQNVSMPRGEVDLFELENTRDFSQSPLHRYRRRSPQEAVSPCPLLHISGIPMELQRNQNALVELFQPYGFVKNFHFIKQNNKMAIIEMATMDEAVMALLCLDNLSYPDSHMRVSFSKTFFQPGMGGPTGGNTPSRHTRNGRSRSRDRDNRAPFSRDRGPGRGRGEPDGGFRRYGGRY